MSVFDLLLQWMSTRGRVSLKTFDEACKSLGKRQTLEKGDALSAKVWRYRLGDSLYRLGHVEFDLRSRSCVIVPSMILWQKQEEGTCAGWLYGARDESLWNTMIDRFGSSCDRLPQSDGPEVWSIKASQESIRFFADRMNLLCFQERGKDLLASLPSLASVMANLVYEPIPSGKWEHLVLSRVAEWKSIDHPAEEGLYRRTDKPQKPGYYVREGKATELRSLESKRIARWYTLSTGGGWRIRYRPDKKQLEIPGIHSDQPSLTLPVLLDRALCMASGSCPTLDESRSYTVYENIDRGRADELARILGMRMTV